VQTVLLVLALERLLLVQELVLALEVVKLVLVLLPEQELQSHLALLQLLLHLGSNFGFRSSWLRYTYGYQSVHGIYDQ
jgi:hypothetical protein